jgi:hypothetical protein
VTIRVHLLPGPTNADLLRKKTLAALDVIVPMIIGMIQRRTGKGVSSDGTALHQYAPGTVDRYGRMGESVKVDLAVTGAYLQGISERSRDVSATGVRVLIGPGTGTSEQRRPPPRDAKNGKPRAMATPHRSPPHNVLGRYLEFGTPRMPARPHLGLTPDEQKRVASKLRQLINQ